MKKKITRSNTTESRFVQGTQNYETTRTRACPPIRRRNREASSERAGSNVYNKNVFKFPTTSRMSDRWEKRIAKTRVSRKNISFAKRQLKDDKVIAQQRGGKAAGSSGPSRGPAPCTLRIERRRVDGYAKLLLKYLGEMRAS